MNAEYILLVLATMVAVGLIGAVRRERTRGPYPDPLGVLADLFRSHGIEAAREDNVLHFPGWPYSVETYGARQSEWAIQFDVILSGFDGDRFLGESVAGVGATDSVAAGDAIMSFANASFHVLLAAFFDQPPCHGTEIEEWVIDGRPRAVFIGPLTSRIRLPEDGGRPDMRFLTAFTDYLKAQLLPTGTHWVRMYQMRMGGVAPVNEVLLDNEPWPEMQDAMARFDWPASDRPYDVRVFLVIKDR